jgi:hypothetical protein
MEGAIEQAMKALSDKAAQAAQQPQQNPEMMKLQLTNKLNRCGCKHRLRPSR